MLSNIMRSTMDSGSIPSILKSAYITPIHKGESRSEPENFRPVSLTSHLVKTFERLIRKQLVSYLERNKLMDDSQHGSRAGRSTLSQLLEHQDEILKDLEEGNNVDAVYLQKPLTNVIMEFFCTRSKSWGSKENWEDGSKTFSRVENRQSLWTGSGRSGQRLSRGYLRGQCWGQSFS